LAFKWIVRTFVGESGGALARDLAASAIEVRKVAPLLDEKRAFACSRLSALTNRNVLEFPRRVLFGVNIEEVARALTQTFPTAAIRDGNRLSLIEKATTQSSLRLTLFDLRSTSIKG
jgi:hypothetical protein